MTVAKELFPLPSKNAVRRFGLHINSQCNLNRSTKRRISRKQHGAEWCDAGLHTLNELSGLPFSECPSVPQSQAQQHALKHVFEVYDEVPQKPGDLSCAGAFRELCNSSSRYAPCEASNRSSYVKELVSWPPVDSSPCVLTECLEGSDFLQASEWQSSFLNSSSERAEFQPLSRPS